MYQKKKKKKKKKNKKSWGINKTKVVTKKAFP